MERKAEDWVHSINLRDLQRHRTDGENYKKSTALPPPPPPSIPLRLSIAGLNCCALGCVSARRMNIRIVRVVQKQLNLPHSEKLLFVGGNLVSYPQSVTCTYIQIHPSEH